MKKGSKHAEWRITGKKTCGCCKKEKSISDFPMDRRRGELVPYSWCKECKRVHARTAVKKYNRNNRERNLNYEQACREKKRDYIHEHYRTSCKKCGENRKHLIDFHHIDPKTKLFEPLNSYQRSLISILCEIEKCVTLCANCHRDFHHQERISQITLNQYLKDA